MIIQPWSSVTPARDLECGSCSIINLTVWVLTPTLSITDSYKHNQ